MKMILNYSFSWNTISVFPKSRQHVCFVRRRIQMSDVEFVKIISIWCLLSGEPDYFGRNKISSGGDLSHYSSASLY